MLISKYFISAKLEKGEGINMIKMRRKRETRQRKKQREEKKEEEKKKKKRERERDTLVWLGSMNDLNSNIFY